MTDRMTVSEYIGNKGANAFYNANDIMIREDQIPEFIRGETFRQALTVRMGQLYGDYRLRYAYTANPGAIPNACMVLYYINEYRYSGLYNSTQQDYNPIENYNMTEEYTEGRQSSGTDTMDYGDARREVDIGAQKSTADYGKQSSSVNAGNVTNTHEVSPDDSGSYVAESRDTTGAHTDGQSIEAHTDTQSVDARRDVTVDKGRTDIRETDNTGMTKHELTRKGNIGVTTSDQMIAQYRQTVNFALVDIIAKDIMQTITNRMLSGEEC